MSKAVFPIGSRWVIYDGEVPDIHVVIGHEFSMSILITECAGERYEWHSSVMHWLAEPFEESS